jgi:hypothetical protein
VRGGVSRVVKWNSGGRKLKSLKSYVPWYSIDRHSLTMSDAPVYIYTNPPQIQPSNHPKLPIDLI